METLKDYEWDTRYSSSTHDLLKDFFIPALSRSAYYYRIAGYFSSTSIAAAIRGISAFVEKGKKMCLVIGADISEEDANAINNGNVHLDEYLDKKWEDCIGDLEDDIMKRRFEILSWLIANGKLDIKIGVNKSSDGRYLPSNVSQFHEKILIFEDQDGNMIQVDGSINETYRAWATNRESFCVHQSWIENQEGFVKTAKEEFDRVWNNLDSKCEILSISEAAKKKLLAIRSKSAPNPEDDADFEFSENKTAQKKIRPLWRHQKDAIKIWSDSKNVGILEMATGTGKTITALSAIRTLDLKSALLMIGVPQIELAEQWAMVCDEIFEDFKHRIVVCHGETDWKIDLAREIRQAKREESLCIVIALFDTMRSLEFKKMFPAEELAKAYLIIDEVHEIGSEENRKLLPWLQGTKCKLGLSATPERFFDSSGNSAISEFFGGPPIFKWDLEKAINPPPGYEGCLTPYKYFVYDVSLNGEELEEYIKLSKGISQMIATLRKGGRDMEAVLNNPNLKFLLLKRAALHKKCEQKYEKLKEIIDKHGSELKKCLVYCNDKIQMENAVRILADKGMKCLKFYGELDADTRTKIFDVFRRGDVNFLVAIKCLDQGVDLPACDSAIIIASSTNPREYVQRRGRILRRHEGKEFSVIYDLIVFPYPLDELTHGKFKLEEYEAHLIRKELARAELFIMNSVNKVDNLIRVYDYKKILETRTSR